MELLNLEILNSNKINFGVLLKVIINYFQILSYITGFHLANP